jgi:hypothetical protein
MLAIQLVTLHGVLACILAPAASSSTLANSSRLGGTSLPSTSCTNCTAPREAPTPTPTPTRVQRKISRAVSCSQRSLVAAGRPLVTFARQPTVDIDTQVIVCDIVPAPQSQATDRRPRRALGA